MGFRPLGTLDESQLKYVINMLEKFKVNEDNCMEIQFGQNDDIDSIQKTVDYALADAKGNSQREELLNRIKDLAHNIRVSATIFAIRYNKEAGGELKRRPDALFLEKISHILNTPVERGDNYSISNFVYIYLTNAKDIDDFIVRLDTINGLLEQYKDTLKEAYDISLKALVDKARKDVESGEILGKKDDERE